ncbi:matrixin family metalloprotease [Candidatus Nitrosotenuis chungbukensis]|uniref:matrixin family metalloprotease n=2 Tax=Candidatus Nitrosotenuis chungbukensis TaxID=1353246 RepID=UPI0005B25E36|nr:matrixin family metalloprotease [Candidatus Nitrosotenuis chungbukensis]
MSTNPIHIAAVMSVLILFSAGSISHAKAETVHVYVQSMPQHWQDKFVDVMTNATRYWEDKTPNLKFETVQYVDKSDFVVEWASQYGEGKLGYYSTNTENAYGKPTMAITLGFFKDREWHLASPEYVLQITKHELGHALGLPHSVDPNDIMYPTIEDYESWLQDSEQVNQVSGSVANWQIRSEKYQEMASEKILPLESKIVETQTLLNTRTYEGNASNESFDDAWTSFWWAKKYLNSAEKMQADGGAFVLELDYYESYIKFKSSYDYAKKAEQKISQIIELVEKADSLEYDN